MRSIYRTCIFYIFTCSHINIRKYSTCTELRMLINFYFIINKLDKMKLIIIIVKRRFIQSSNRVLIKIRRDNHAFNERQHHTFTVFFYSPFKNKGHEKSSLQVGTSSQWKFGAGLGSRLKRRAIIVDAHCSHTRELYVWNGIKP